MHNQIASFRAALDAPVSRYQWLLLLLLALLLVTDGYDAQVLGYVVPTWPGNGAWTGRVRPSVQRQPVRPDRQFAAGAAPLADRFGIRRVLLCCVLIYASLTVLMVFAGSWKA